MIDFLKVRLLKCRHCLEPCEHRSVLAFVENPMSRCPRAGKAPAAETWFQLPAGFGTGQQTRVRRPAKQRRAEWGPPMWAKLHRWALRPPEDQSEILSYIQDFGGEIPMCPCRTAWHRMMKQTPPPAAPAKVFGWTVERHNEINALLRKPLISESDARAIWAKDS